MTSNDLVLKLLINAQDNTGGATKSAGGNIESLSSIAQKASKLIASYLSFRVLVAGGEEFIKLADQASGLRSRLQLVTKSQEEFNAAERALFAVAQDTRSSLSTVVDLYVKTDQTIRTLGKTQEDSIAFNRLVGESFKISGAGATESDNAIRQLIQGLQSGVLRGDEFNAVMEEGPRLAKALADGLGVTTGELRAMAEAGKLTSNIVINTLLGQAPKISAEYQAMAPTVEGAMVQMENALLRYVGQVNQAHGITTKMAGGISALANHIDDLIAVGEVLGTLLMARVVSGLAASTAALITNTQAARDKTTADAAAVAAQRELLILNEATAQIYLKTANIQAASARTAYELAVAETVATESKANAARLSALRAGQSAEAEAALTAAEIAAAQAANREAVAQENLAKALDNQRLASSRAQTANTATTASTSGMGNAAAQSSKALNGFNAILAIFSGWAIGDEIGSWATQFEKVRVWASYLSETWVQLGVDWQLLQGKLSWDEYMRESVRIGQEFDRTRQNLSETAQAAEDSQKRITEATNQQAAAQRQALDLLQGKLKDSTTIIDAEYQRQIQAGELALSARLAQIAASGQAENIIGQQSAAANRQALADRLVVLDQYGQRRLAAITSLLGTQEQMERMGETVRKATEQVSLQARIDAYGDLAKGYAVVVDQLQGQWQREMTLYNQGTENIKTMERGYEHQILEIRRSAMTEREKIRSQEQERDAAIAKLKNEQAKGTQADEKELNRLYGEASKLIDDVSKTNQARYKTNLEKSAESRKAEGLLKGIWDDQKTLLEQINSQHKTNADFLLPSLDSAKLKVADVNKALGDLDAQLAKSKELKINIDQASVSAAQSAIDALTAPATKTITIQTVNAGAPGESAPAEGHRFGGLIRALANGGKLPGYGGGDIVPAMLEPGEYVINKQATQAALPILEAINRGKLPGFADGGLVERIFEKGFQSSLDKKLLWLVNAGHLFANDLSGPANAEVMAQTIRDIQLAIARAPATIQGKLREQVGEKIADLLAQTQQSIYLAADNQNDPLSVTQNTPGLMQRLEGVKAFYENALKQLGVGSLGGAALGGFMPQSQNWGTPFLQNVTPNFNLPNLAANAISSLPSMPSHPKGTQTELVRHVFDFGNGKQTEFDVSRASSDVFTAGLKDLLDQQRRSG